MTVNAVIATTPQGMVEAQGAVTKWIDARVEHWNQTLGEAEGLADSLRKANMPTRPAGTQILKARKHLEFYTKVKAALAAGYYIVPPFPVALFAIRCDEDEPEAMRSERHWPTPFRPAAQPIGTGRYVNPSPTRKVIEVEQQPNASGQGTHAVSIYENIDWRDVELPMRAMKPEVIAATAKALGERIFDALGILPTAKASDPLIVGQIVHPVKYREPLTFFVAWWLDSRDI